ncbi:hypothetical protein HDV00_006477 [Rhizophlyctis rosea]|nr:hypothetical protein HDV00_006477 [Rhizophlyctis rosea]
MAATNNYPTPLHKEKEEFPTPAEAAQKGLNPNPPPLETGLSDMPELPELTHNAAPAHGPGVAVPTSGSKTDKGPTYNDESQREAAKKKAKRAVGAAKDKAVRSGWLPTSLEDAWEKYWPAVATAAALGVAYVVVNRRYPQALPVWLRRP